MNAVWSLNYLGDSLGLFRNTVRKENEVNEFKIIYLIAQVTPSLFKTILLNLLGWQWLAKLQGVIEQYGERVNKKNLLQ